MTSPPAHHDPDTLADATVTAARLAGCTCEPTLELELVDHVDGQYRATISHNAGCPIVSARADRLIG